MKKLSYKVSLGGVIAAIAVIVMFLTGVAPVLTYLCPMLAGILFIIIVVEISIKWSFATYGAVAILSIFMTPDKEAALLFVFFLGYYPIVKSLLEQMKNRVIEWILKLVIFNVSVICAYWLIINVFGMEQMLESLKGGFLGVFGDYVLLVFLLAGNVTFVLYDFAVSRIIQFYINTFRTDFLRKINK